MSVRDLYYSLSLDKEIKTPSLQNPSVQLLEERRVLMLANLRVLYLCLEIVNLEEVELARM